MSQVSGAGSQNRYGARSRLTDRHRSDEPARSRLGPGVGSRANRVRPAPPAGRGSEVRAVSAIGRATSCCVRISPIALVVLAAMAPSAAAATLREKLSGPSPFTPQCSGPEQGGLLYPNAEVEPWVAANPATRRNLVAVWQQDRWSNGGARGLLSAYSLDGGRSWARSTAPPFAHCEGGTAANGGDYERASDPWVSIGPDGSAHQIARGEHQHAAPRSVRGQRPSPCRGFISLAVYAFSWNRWSAVRCPRASDRTERGGAGLAARVRKPLRL